MCFDGLNDLNKIVLAYRSLASTHYWRDVHTLNILVKLSYWIIHDSPTAYLCVTYYWGGSVCVSVSNQVWIFSLWSTPNPPVPHHSYVSCVYASIRNSSFLVGSTFWPCGIVLNHRNMCMHRIPVSYPTGKTYVPTYVDVSEVALREQDVPYLY